MVIDNRNRVFHYAVLASLALHALVLLAFPELVDTARRAASIPPQIIARLMEPEPAPPPPARVQEPEAKKSEVKKPEAKKPPPRVSQPLPAVEAPVAPAARAEPEPAPQPAPTVEPQPAPPPVAAAPQAAPAAPAPQSVPAPQPAPVADARSRDQYRLQLMEEMVRNAKQRHPPRGYPPLARENNWEGNVTVAIAVTPDGRASVTLKKSSGYDVLDQLALETVRHAARRIPVPPALRGRDFAVDLSAIYRLED